jgi:hypothetical protein
LSATSAAPLSAAAKPSSSSARSRCPASVAVSIGREHELERLELERCGSAQLVGADLAAEPGHHRGDGAGVARVGVVLRAVRGRDRRRAAWPWTSW